MSDDKKPETTTATHEEIMEAWTRPLTPISFMTCLCCFGRKQDGAVCIGCKGKGLIVIGEKP